MTLTKPENTREIVFISKATPGDDEFVLWLAPRLEAAGYQVFADILTLEPGDRWRKVITAKLQDCAIKMLLCCRDSTLIKDGVQEEIGIALDLSEESRRSKIYYPASFRTVQESFRNWRNSVHRLRSRMGRWIEQTVGNAQASKSAASQNEHSDQSQLGYLSPP